VPTDGNEQPTEIDRGLGLLALATTYVNPSPARSARATSSIALLWSWKFATSGLNDFPSIRAFFVRRTRLGFEESPEIVAAARHRTKSEPEDSSLLNVVHQLRAALARPWPVSAYAEVSQRPDSKGDQCGGFAARGVTGRIRQLHARVRQHP
jgi:hypothetical protein